MKHSHLILMIVAVAVVGAIAFFMPRDTAKHSDIPVIPAEGAVDGGSPSGTAPGVREEDTLVIDGKPVAALCFAHGDMEESLSFYPVENCDETLERDPRGEPAPFGDRFVSASYTANDDSAIRGIVGYRFIGEYEEKPLVWLVHNTGGTGVFSSLLLMSYNADMKRLETTRVIASGDRCNGSVTGAQISGSELLYQTDVTPLEILALIEDSPTLQSAAADAIPSCAVCCYGAAQYSGETLAGVQFDRRLIQAIGDKTYEADDDAAKCFDNLVLDRFNTNKGFCDSACLEGFVRSVKEQCLGEAADGD